MNLLHYHDEKKGTDDFFDADRTVRLQHGKDKKIQIALSTDGGPMTFVDIDPAVNKEKHAAVLAWYAENSTLLGSQTP